jgi:hypothetical protein
MTDEAATDELDMAGQRVASRGEGDCFLKRFQTASTMNTYSAM